MLRLALLAVSVTLAVAEADRRAASPLWPGFDPRATPLAVFDGERTWLFRHPHPPAGFVREGQGWVMAGRHPALTANTSFELAGALTAGVLLDGKAEVETTALAGTLIHEAFHAFQRQRHRDWDADEGALFSYPAGDGALLGWRRLESLALQRALGESDGAAWARAALLARRERFARLPPEAVAYERKTELKEGLAQFVEDQATGRPPSSRWPAGEFAPDGIRWRGYASGQALAVLLERFDKGWQSAIETQGGTLDERLAAALGEGATADLAPHRAAVIEAAERDASALRASKEARRRAFLDAPGTRLEVEAAAGAPLFPHGFDPLNVVAFPDGAVLHTRFLKLGNAAGTVEVLGRAALTEAAGRHPLFEGVRRLRLTGLSAMPSVQESAGTVRVEAEGLKLELRGARVVRSPEGLRIEL
ncbi:MAG TPA: hypothetical protein VF310_02875 [Vicinamibacteria bacterium]